MGRCRYPSKVCKCGARCWGSRCSDCVKRGSSGPRSKDRHSSQAARPCLWCGLVFSPRVGSKGDACSRRCAGFLRRGEVPSASRELVHVPAQTRRVDAVERLAVAAVGSCGDRVWVAGSCGVCGGAFVGLRHALYPVCGSDACVEERDRRVEHDKRARRRARLAGARVGRVDRERVFVRDGYRCHLCGVKTSPSAVVPDLRAPTLDHIVPLSLGGEHSMVNVACACFGCNSRKSNVGFGDQLALFG